MDENLSSRPQPEQSADSLHSDRPVRADEARQARRELRSKAANEKGAAASAGSLALSVVFCAAAIFGEAGWLFTLLIALCEIFLFALFGATADPVNRRRALVPAGFALLIALGSLLHPVFSVFPICLLTIAALIMVQLTLLSCRNCDGIFTDAMASLTLSRVVFKPLGRLSLYFFGFSGIEKVRSRSARSLLSALLGAAAALPFLALLLNLLAGGDPLFGDALNRIAERLDFSAGRLAGELILGFVISIFVGSAVVYGLVVPNAEPTRPKLRLSAVGCGVFALLVDAVMAIFAFMQLKYLFVRAVTPLVESVGYAEYARQGFFELARASALVFAAAAVITALCRNENERSPALIRASIGLMCLFDGVALASAAQRMLLYIEMYGLSVKRLICLWFMVLLALALLAVLIKCAAVRFRSLAAIALSVSVMVSALALTNIGRVISSYNTERYIAGEIPLDLDYNRQIGPTCLPDLLRLRDSGAPCDLEELESAIEHMTYLHESRRLSSWNFDELRLADSLRGEG